MDIKNVFDECFGGVTKFYIDYKIWNKQKNGWIWLSMTIRAHTEAMALDDLNYIIMSNYPKGTLYEITGIEVIKKS